MARVFLSLGSNLGDRVAHLRGAVHALRRASEIEFLAASRLYESEPWEGEPGQTAHEQRWYLNCVVMLETTLSPQTLLTRLQAIETKAGRTRPPGTPEAQRFVDRSLDIDILFYGDQVISVPDELHVPHLLLHERGFVLQPLAELAADLEHPTLYRTVRELVDELADEHHVRPRDDAPRWFED